MNLRNETLNLFKQSTVRLLMCFRKRMVHCNAGLNEIFELFQFERAIKVHAITTRAINLTHDENELR